MRSACRQDQGVLRKGGLTTEDLRSRRNFLVAVAQAGGSALLAGRSAPSLDEASHPRSLPRRRLGRAGIEVPIIGLGLAPLGLGRYSPRELRRVVEFAIGEGVGYLDVQPDYGEVERLLAPVLRQSRDRLFLVTKTWEKNKQGVLESIRGSLERMRVPFLDAVLLNNIGDFDTKRLFDSDGPFAGLVEARRRGQVRFLGLSGHYSPGHFVEALKNGEFDLVMAPFNFVDRHLYTFEQDILPAARKHDLGIIAMKTLGGAVGLKYDTRAQKALLSRDDHRISLHYVLGLPQMSCAVIGCKSVEEVRLATRTAREYQPLSETEMISVLARGRELAAKWGPHYPEG